MRYNFEDIIRMNNDEYKRLSQNQLLDIIELFKQNYKQTILFNENLKKEIDTKKYYLEENTKLKIEVDKLKVDIIRIKEKVKKTSFKNRLFGNFNI